MAYSTQADCERAAGGAARLVDLTDQSSTGSLDLVVLAAAQAQADQVVDGWAQRLYPVPFQPPIPPRLVNLAADEAVYILKGWRSVVGEADHAAHQERVRWLEHLSTGHVTLGNDPYPVGTESTVPAVVERDDGSYDVTRGNLKGFW